MQNGDVVLVTDRYEVEDYKLVGAVGVVAGRPDEDDWPEVDDPVQVRFRNIERGDTHSYIMPSSALRRVGAIAGKPSQSEATNQYDPFCSELHMP